MSEKINNEIYNHYGDRWYTANDDPVALLRAEALFKNRWISNILTSLSIKKASTCLDIGCGGGFLTNFLANKGFKSTGLDISKSSIEIAKKYDISGSAKYVQGDAYSLPFEDNSFDIITCMDFLEHVEDPYSVLKEVKRVLKPEGLFFYHTFNRNILSYLIIIKLVELLVPNTPKNMHLYKLFIKPKELIQYLNELGFENQNIVGVRPKIFQWAIIKGILTRKIPSNFKFNLSKSLMLGYMGYSQYKERQAL